MLFFKPILLDASVQRAVGDAKLLCRLLAIAVVALERHLYRLASYVAKVKAFALAHAYAFGIVYLFCLCLLVGVEVGIGSIAVCLCAIVVRTGGMRVGLYGVCRIGVYMCVVRRKRGQLTACRKRVDSTVVVYLLTERRYLVAQLANVATQLVQYLVQYLSLALLRVGALGSCGGKLGALLPVGYKLA